MLVSDVARAELQNLGSEKGFEQKAQVISASPALEELRNTKKKWKGGIVAEGLSDQHFHQP